MSQTPLLHKSTTKGSHEFTSVSIGQMHFLLLFSRQGKLRLQKWFLPLPERERKKIIRDMSTMVLARKPRTCNFLHWRDLKIVYKRWALNPDLMIELLWWVTLYHWNETTYGLFTLLEKLRLTMFILSTAGGNQILSLIFKRCELNSCKPQSNVIFKSKVLCHSF